MPLQYPPDWKFEGFSHEIPIAVHREFFNLIELMVEGVEKPQNVYEDFKSAYGVNTRSSDPSWADTDMQSAMRSAMNNAARYVASFYAGLEKVEKRGIVVPPVNVLNRILADHTIPLKIDPPHLKLREGDIEFVEENSAEESLAFGFVLGEEIGYGAFGRVHKVTRKTKLGEYHFAMKVFAPSSFNSNRDRAYQRFIRELRSLEKLQHRAIIPLLEAGLNAEGVPYILMPLVDGKSLRDALEGAAPAKIFEVFDEILFAMEFAHGRGILHRDLKPKNILVRTVDEQPQILDFGAAFLLDEEKEELTTTFIGTDAYVPEEVRLNPTNRTPQQDVYACGMLLYEVIARRLPRPNAYEPLKGQVNGFDELDELIQRALAPEHKRFTTIAHMREDFWLFGAQVNRPPTLKGK